VRRCDPLTPGAIVVSAIHPEREHGHAYSQRLPQPQSRRLGRTILRRLRLSGAHARKRAAVVQRREVTGRVRIKTIDVHCHWPFPGARPGQGTGMEEPARQQLDGRSASRSGPTAADMDHDGIDVEAMSINPFWYEPS